MRSPFPGVDPYVEACGLWEGFRGRLIEGIYRAIAVALPRGYTIDTAIRRYVLFMGPEGKDVSLAKPDVTVTERAATRRDPAKPVRMKAFDAERIEESFIEIYAEREDRFLVTCIEVLSPSNKRQGTEGWRVYERKRQALLLGQANFIEIDLLRGGHKMPMLTPWPDSPYTLLVCRASEAPYCTVWPVSLQESLPVIPVPLFGPDPDLTLDLQPILGGIYELGRYDERIDYAQPLNPPLPDRDAAWVRDVLKNRLSRSGGRRGRS